jgi:hypothetical protein
MNRAMRRKKLRRFIDVHREDVADALAFELYGQRFRREARSAACFACHLHVGQETHLDGLQPLAFARPAASACGVEREAPCAVAAHARLVGVREHLADRVPESDVSRRTRARRLADRRLVHFEHAADLFPASDVATAE